MKTETISNSLAIVNRFKEIDLFENYLLQLHTRNGASKSIIDFWGIPGIGKSTLLHGIFEKSLAHKYKTIFIDFRELFALTKRLSDSEARELISAKLYSQMFDIEAFSDSKISSRSASRGDPNKLSTEFVNKTINYLSIDKKRSFVFLFDSVEYCKPEIFEWLERYVFSPLVSTKKVLIVLGSQSRKKWQTFDIKQCVVEYQIQPFDPRLILEQIGYDDVSSKDLANKIFEISFGVPACNLIVFKSLEKLYEKKGLNVAFSDSNKAKCTRSEVQFFHKQTVHRLSSELKYVLEAISQLRWFDYALLREVLVSIHPEIYGNGKASKFRDITRQLEQTNYISWDIQNKGFAMDFTLRKILSLNLKLNHNAVFLQIQRIVLQWFRRLVDEYDSSYLYFLDLIYYRVLFDDLEPVPSEIDKAIRDIQSSQKSHLNKITTLEQVIHLTNEVDYKEVIPFKYIELIRRISEDAIEKLLNTEN